MSKWTHVLVRETAEDQNGRTYESLRIAEVYLNDNLEPGAMGGQVDVIVYADLDIPEEASSEPPSDRTDLIRSATTYAKLDLPAARGELRGHLVRLLQALDKPAYDYAPGPGFRKIEEE